MISNTKSEQIDGPGSHRIPAQTTQSPDLLPFFISFGVLVLLALAIILICFVCRRSHGGYSNNAFTGGSRAMRSFCGKATAVGKKQQGRHFQTQNSVEMKQPIAEINNSCPETAPFVANSFSMATSPNLERRLISNQQHHQQYHQYQTPKNVLLIPPPNSPAPPPPNSIYSPIDLANHRAFTQIFTSQLDREVDGGEKQLFMANSTLFSQPGDASQQLEHNSASLEPVDRSLQTIDYPLVQIK